MIICPEKSCHIKPTVGDHQHRLRGKDARQACEHVDRLLELSSKLHGLFPLGNGLGLQVLFHEIKLEGQGETAPASFDGFQQADGDDLL